MSGTWDFEPLPLSAPDRARIAALRAAHPEGVPDHCAACGVRYPCVRDPDLWVAATAAGEFVLPLHGRSAGCAFHGGPAGSAAHGHPAGCAFHGRPAGSAFHGRPGRSATPVPAQEEK